MLLAGGCRSSILQVGRWPDLAKGILRHLDDRRVCDVAERNRPSRTFAWEVDFASRQNGSCVSGAETEETKKMDFPSPPHTPFAGPNQGAKRPHTHKLKVALGYSHDNKPIQAKKPIFQKIVLRQVLISRV